MKIHNKLFVVFIVFTTALVSALVSLTQWSIDKGMINYVNQREIAALTPFMGELVQIYQQNDSWDTLRDNHRRFERLLNQTLKGTEFSPPHKENRPPPPRKENRPAPRKNKDRNNERVMGGRKYESERSNNHQSGRDKPPSSQNNFDPQQHKRPPEMGPQVSYALLDIDKNYLVGIYPPNREYSFTPLKLADKTIGFMAISKRNRLTQGYEFDFVEQQKDSLWYIAIVVMLFVMLITFPFARHLVSPIRSLKKGMYALTQGQYKSRLTTNRKDEFAQLTRDFNELAETLMENESARKRWLANISHELRTPVAILKGELEAIIDGVRELSIEQVNSAHQEVTHLQRLIADLHALTSADIGGMSYRKQSVDLVEFINNEANKLRGYLQKESLTLVVDNELTEAVIYADETRLCQLLENLINNCIKYAKAGTQVKLSLCLSVIKSTIKDEDKKEVRLIIEDDGIGVGDKHLALLFEHLYRVEDSRNRKTGGTGLGLSICAHIVQAHQGTIYAEKSSLGGLAIHISLPLQ